MLSVSPTLMYIRVISLDFSVVLVRTKQIVGSATIVCLVFKYSVLYIVNWVPELGQSGDPLII